MGSGFSHQQSSDRSKRDTNSRKKMPWFRKQSDQAKKKLQHQLYLARESPEATFDISGCEITDIPSGVFSLCKVLQKNYLLAHNNWLTSLKGGGNFRDLQHLQWLDLHDNDLASLPDELGYLSHLQVLNVANNKLKQLPSSLEHLKCLITLKCKGNKLKQIPDALCNLKSLRHLDVSDNLIHKLPTDLAQVRTLEEVVVDSSNMSYPSKEICSQGTEAIMRFLCQECDISYVPPHDVSGATPSPPASPCVKSPSNCHIEDMLKLQKTENAFKFYAQNKERKRSQLLALEQQLEEEQALQATLAARATDRRQQMVELMTQDQDRLHDELSQLQLQRDEERQRMVTSLQQAEANSTHLVQELLAMNERSRKTEELLEQMEKERMEMERWFEVRQEEVELLRKQDVIVNMERMMQENNQIIANYFSERDEVVKRTQDETIDKDQKFSSMMAHKQEEQAELFTKLIKEESIQKKAFEALMCERDAKHKRITSQIDLIESELAQLTLIEVEQRQLKVDCKINILAEKRSDLSQLLVQLLGERERREAELRHRLTEMEKRREDDQTDYWLVQYQRLMDMKPQAMINMEKRLEHSVVEVLEAAQATDYTPLFSRHRISIETLCSLQEDDLKQMGIHELGVRRALMTEINKYKLRKEEERAAAKLKNIHKDDWLVKPPAPSVASTSARAQPVAPPPATAPVVREVTARVNTECVVCMERNSVMLFLNCGHICCCAVCADPLIECPMCRGVIVQRIKLHTV